MISIYLCDDQSVFLSEMTQLVERAISINEVHFHIELATQKPDELLGHLKVSTKPSIYFLDVDLGKAKMNGFELGKRIRDIDSRGFIIYVTTHEELLSETFTYRLETLDYIVKDDISKMTESITRCLIDIDKRMGGNFNDNRQYFAVKKGARTTYVLLEEILYFETTPKKHVVALITREGRTEFYGSLAEVTRQLSEDFLRVHRSFLVNMLHIKSCNYQGKELSLSHGKKCDIGREKMKEIRRRLK